MAVLLVVVLIIFYSGLYAWTALPGHAGPRRYKLQYDNADPAAKAHRRPVPQPVRVGPGGRQPTAAPASHMASVGKAALVPGRGLGPTPVGFMQPQGALAPPPTHPVHSHGVGPSSPPQSGYHPAPEVAKVMHGGAAGVAAATGATMTQRVSAASSGGAPPGLVPAPSAAGPSPVAPLTAPLPTTGIAQRWGPPGSIQAPLLGTPQALRPPGAQGPLLVTRGPPPLPSALPVSSMPSTGGSSMYGLGGGDMPSSQARSMTPQGGPFRLGLLGAGGQFPPGPPGKAE